MWLMATVYAFFVAVFCWLLIFEIAIPLSENKKMFPSFRKKKKRAEVEAIKTLKAARKKPPGHYKKKAE